MLVVLETLGGGLGDEICSEPVVRYACEQLYPNEDVRICTKYPEVFKHLKKPCGKNKQELDMSENEEFFHLSASPYKIVKGEHTTHPFALIAQPLFISTIDFHSMFMLRRILPDKDKQVYLEVTKESIQKVKELGVPKEFIAFHVGTSLGDSKKFPKKYIQSIVNNLVALGHNVVIFGKTDEEIKIEKVIDLTNKLDIEMTFALVKLAWLLITNDSAPLHIAAAFNNFIILIPTIKHPDRLLHVRNGSRYWRAAALYKKLMVDDRDFPPHLDCGSWYPAITNKEEYLPEIKDILKTTERFKKEYDISRKI